MLTSYQCICMCTPSFISKIVRRMRKMTNLFHDFCMEHHHWSQSWKVGITEEQDSVTPLLWRHNECDGASKHRRLHCLPNRLFRRRSKKTLKAPRNWLFVRESTGDRWIPLTKCQLRGKCFHHGCQIDRHCWHLGLSFRQSQWYQRHANTRVPVPWWPFTIIWINFNPSMDNLSHVQ